MKLNVKLGVAGIICVMTTACTSSSNTVKVRGQDDPIYYVKSSSSPVSASYTSETTLPAQWGGGFYGYPGGASFLTPGQQALVRNPGSAVVVGVPATSVSAAASTRDDAPATNAQVKAMGKAIVTVTKNVCNVLRSQGKECE